MACNDSFICHDFAVVTATNDLESDRRRALEAGAFIWVLFGVCGFTCHGYAICASRGAAVVVKCSGTDATAPRAIGREHGDIIPAPRLPSGLIARRFSPAASL